MDSPIQAKRTLSVMTTFACTAACKDCGTLSSPKSREEVPRDAILRTIKQAHELGFYNVVFTGGEVTLRWALLLECISYAKQFGFPTRIVTNAHWAHTMEDANRCIRQLVVAGLDEINLSTGDEHARFVPLERIEFAVIAAVNSKLRLSVMVELRDGNTCRKADIHRRLQSKLTDEDLDRFVNIIESPWMPLRYSTPGSYPPGVAFTKSNLSAAKGCDSILQTYVLQGDGRIASCCGLGIRMLPELNVGNISDGDLGTSVNDAESDLFKYAIRYMGTEKILAWAAEKNPMIKWEGMYAHRCQACQRIYRDPVVKETIREWFHELVTDVMFSAWLEEDYVPKNPELGTVATSR